MVSPSKTAAPGENIPGQVTAAPLLWPAEWIGARAKSLLDAHGFSGQVIAVLSDCAYLSSGEGEILWLVQEGAPRHRRGIPIPFPPRSLRAGQGCLREKSTLKIGGKPEIDLSRAVEWKPQALDQAEIVPLSQVKAFVRPFLATISPALCAEGPGRVILELASLSKGGEPLPFLPLAWQDRMLNPVLDLMKHCLRGGLADLGTRGRELIGLGPGLTPWGDDFLGGLLFAVQGIREACPGQLPVETPATSDLIDWARHRTHPVSLTILADLARGHGPEPLHDLFRLLLTGAEPAEEVGVALGGLLEIGHTTGGFILAGMLTGLLAATARQTAA